LYISVLCLLAVRNIVRDHWNVTCTSTGWSLTAWAVTWWHIVT